jgi:hypothetical protein
MYYLLAGKHPVFEKGQTLQEFKAKLTTTHSQDWQFPPTMSK